MWKERVRNILNELRIPLTLLAASGKDHFRKPRIGMWDHYRVKLIPPELTASNNHEDSFYVGDAAGRPNNWKSKAKKDFSDSDLKFALNIPLKFHTPESFWDGESVPSFMPTFQPRLFLMETSKKPPILFAPTHRPLVSSSQEIIIFVGVRIWETLKREYFLSLTRSHTLLNISFLQAASLHLPKNTLSPTATFM